MGAVILNAAGFAGCANSCFVFVSSNGSSGVFVKVEDPPPVCSLGQAKGAVRATVLKSPMCETCTTAAKVQHVFLTVRSIQLRLSTMSETEPSEWLEIAPQLAEEPKRIDLIGDSSPEVLAERGLVPAGSYTELRLEFLSGSASTPNVLPNQNACGEARWNCVVMDDGRIEPFHWPGDVPELIVPLANQLGALTIAPDSKMDVQLRLRARRELHFAGTEGLKMQSALAGEATVTRQGELY